MLPLPGDPGGQSQVMGLGFVRRVILGSSGLHAHLVKDFRWCVIEWPLHPEGAGLSQASILQRHSSCSCLPGVAVSQISQPPGEMSTPGRMGGTPSMTFKAVRGSGKFRCCYSFF
jgi:hypothetical protein